MAPSDRQLLDALSRLPFADSTELAGILGEPHSTVHRALTGLLADGIAGRFRHGTAHLSSSQRYFITVKRHQADRRGPGLRRALGLRAGLPHVQGVANAAYAQDGRRGRRLQTRGLDVPRRRRAPVPRGVPPQGPLRRHHHTPRRAQLGSPTLPQSGHQRLWCIQIRTHRVSSNAQPLGYLPRRAPRTFHLLPPSTISLQHLHGFSVDDDSALRWVNSISAISVTLTWALTRGTRGESYYWVFLLAPASCWSHWSRASTYFMTSSGDSKDSELGEDSVEMVQLSVY